MCKNFRNLTHLFIYTAVFFIIFGENYFVRSITTSVFEIAYDYYLPAEETEISQPAFRKSIRKIRAKPTPTPTPHPPTPAPTFVHITEEQFWEALVIYRQTHNKNQIQKSESLCVYARERVNELVSRFKTNPENPLDAHDGFNRDAESGYVFEKTGFNRVGENLAYTPSLATATQIIEWGWDTSSGHRGLQLSNDVTYACITGMHPIYAGIFALK